MTLSSLGGTGHWANLFTQYNPDKQTHRETERGQDREGQGEGGLSRASRFESVMMLEPRVEGWGGGGSGEGLRE